MPGDSATVWQHNILLAELNKNCFNETDREREREKEKRKKVAMNNVCAQFYIVENEIMAIKMCAFVWEFFKNMLQRF